MKFGYTYWQDGGVFLGYLDGFPDYESQGRSLADLEDHLVDFYKEITSGEIPNVRKHGELVIS